MDFYPAGGLSINDARAALGLGPLPTDEEWDELAGRHPGSWWRSWQHPRGRDGEFIEKGGKVRAKFGSKWKTGVARKMNQDNTVTVEADDGDVRDIHPADIITEAKAIIPGEPSDADIHAVPGLPEKPQAAPRGQAQVGMREADPSEWAALGVTPAQVGKGGKVLVHDDPQGKAIEALIVNPQGKVAKYLYTAQHKAYQSAAKFRRMREVHKQHKIHMAKMREDAKTDPVAAAALVMATTGMRPSSETQLGQKGKSYGATTLEGRHVTFGKDADGNDTVRFQFQGKSDQKQDLISSDPALVAAMRAHTAGKGPNDQLFPGVNRTKTAAYVKAGMGPNIKNKDLRTYEANMLALRAKSQVEAAFPGGPKDAKQFNDMRNMLGRIVAGQLGNTQQVALNSYITPAVFNTWASRLGPQDYDSIMDDLWSRSGQ